jgi:hypothetical protein
MTGVLPVRAAPAGEALDCRPLTGPRTLVGGRVCLFVCRCLYGSAEVDTGIECPYMKTKYAPGGGGDRSIEAIKLAEHDALAF